MQDYGSYFVPGESLQTASNCQILVEPYLACSAGKQFIQCIRLGHLHQSRQWAPMHVPMVFPMLCCPVNMFCKANLLP